MTRISVLDISICVLAVGEEDAAPPTLGCVEWNCQHEGVTPIPKNKKMQPCGCALPTNNALLINF